MRWLVQRVHPKENRNGTGIIDSDERQSGIVVELCVTWMDGMATGAELRLGFGLFWGVGRGLRNWMFRKR